MLGLLTGFKTYLIIGGVVLLILTGFYLYYKDAQSRIERLSQTVATNVMVIAQQNNTIDQLKKAEEIRKYVMEQYYEELEAARNEVNSLESRIAQMNAETGETETINQALQEKLEATEEMLNREYNLSQKCISLYSGVDINKLETNKDAQDNLRRVCGIVAR